MKFALALRKLRDRIENMRVRTRLVVLMLLFGIAVAINILALLFLARSVSSSLDLIESARSRQLVAVEMHEKLRNAEAALYRYDLEGEAGFATQFDDQIGSFGASVARGGWQNGAGDERVESRPSGGGSFKLRRELALIGPARRS